MWENRKLASWVVSCVLSALHFNQDAEIVWWNVWLLAQKNKCSERRKLPACRQTMCSLAGNWSKAATDGRNGVFLRHFWLASPGSPPKDKESWSETAVSSTPSLCNTHTRAVCCCFLCQLVVFTLSAPWARGVTRGWRCSLTASLWVDGGSKTCF